MKKLLTNTTKALIGIVATAIVTNFITGQPLTGLTKLKGLYQTFIKSSVPAWAFALVFLVALLGIYSALSRWPKRKGKVHFVPDVHNVGWSMRGNAEMDVKLAGMFSYDGPDNLVVLQIFLKGTRPLTNLDVLIEPQGADGPVRVSELWLDDSRPQRVFTNLTLRPLIGKPGKSLRRKFVFRDKYNRDFPIGPIDFPYIGQRSRQE